MSRLYHATEMNGHKYDFGNEFVFESVSEAFFGTSDTDSDMD